MSKFLLKISKTLQLEVFYNINGKIDDTITKIQFKFNPKNTNWLYKEIDFKTVQKLYNSLKIIVKKNKL